jgi:catechol 2,3-dioxygenase-like lactoylglutathione lyase family enzyme
VAACYIRRRFEVTIEFIGAIPVIPVQDVPAAVAFYRDKLGFAPVFEMDGYAVIQRAPVEFHLDGFAEWPRPQTTCRVNLTGVDELYADIEPKGIVDPKEPLATQPHGMRQFSVLDPWGNRITFAEPVS